MVSRKVSRSLVIAGISALALIAVACGSTSKSVEGDGSTSVPTDAEEVDVEELFARELGEFWRTDFTKHSIDLDEIVSGGPGKNGIRSIDEPKFQTIKEGEGDVVDREPVIVVEVDGDARAYPLAILTRHEIVNDVVAGVPVAVTFCPLCNSAIVFQRELDGVLYDFGVSGFLRNSDLIMFDRQTESWWQQFTGDAIVGELTGALLDVVPSSVASWADFKATHPDGQVLSRDTGYAFDYGFNPYVNYDSDEDPFLFLGEPDTRLSPIERVVAVDLNDDPVAYPFSLLNDIRVVEDTVGGDSIVVFHQPGTASALAESDIAEGRDIGASGVFLPEAAGRALTFRAEGDVILDNETNSRWNVLGVAVEGPLAGEELTPVIHGDHFWFAWSAFNPETRIFEE